MGKQLRRGDMVEVKNATEILATLDNEDMLDALPFMPEMLQYCGRRFVVDRRAEKICDTIRYSGSRRLRSTVLLEDLRCDGSGHDGCQADCRLFWKESWLRLVEPNEIISPKHHVDEDSRPLYEVTSRYIKRTVGGEGRTDEVYRCQATELLNATTRLKLWDPIPYIREFICGNVPFGRFLRISLKAFFIEPLRILGFFPHVFLKGTHSGPKPEDVLNLQPGDWVQVKTLDEIVKLLSPVGTTRGLWFDREMVPYCGGTFQVRQRIKRFIHDGDGRMIHLKRESVTLEGAVCSGELSMRRWFCARQIYPYWRESWLRRVNVESPSEITPPSTGQM